MIETALYPVLTAAGAQFSEYRGANTAARFTSPELEFAALRDGCGVYDLGWNAFACVEGRDRVRWLNGMISNNVRDLQPKHAVYSFVLNPQGRIQGDLFALQVGESFLLQTDLAQQERLFALLRRYIIMDQVTFTDESDITAIGVQGPQAPALLRRLGILRELAPLEIEDCNLNGAAIHVLRLDAPLTPVFEIIVAARDAAAIWKSLVNAGATLVGSEAVELMRIASGIPAYGQDIGERDLPQETGQQRALDFAKGCYIGQEIVERIRSRGQVHRQFTGFVFDGGPIAPSTKIEADGKEVGEITSVAQLPLADGTQQVGLGYIRREAAAELKAAGVLVRTAALPFVLGPVALAHEPAGRHA